MLISEDEAAKQNQKILSIFLAKLRFSPPVPPAEGRRGKDFLVFAASEASGRGARVGVGTGSARTIQSCFTTRSARELVFVLEISSREC
jgi:hypothetical protein